MRLSDHFTLAEMIRSQTASRLGIDNTPDLATVDNLLFVCKEILEPLRVEHGPIHVSSGYRCPKLNTAIGGSKTSAHRYGLAADHVTSGLELIDEVAWFLDHTDIPWDQVILEYGSWIHVGAARRGQAPRHQALMIFRGTGYLPFDDTKARELMTADG